MSLELRALKERVDRMDHSKVDIAVFKSAFAGGDPDGHRRYHEHLLELTEEKRRLRRAIQEKTISGLFWMMLVSAGTAIWRRLEHYLPPYTPPH